MTRDYSMIQPIRFFIEADENISKNYFEKNHNNIKHDVCLCPEHALIPFAFNVPTLVNYISACNLYCPDGTTVKFAFKAKLKNETDLKMFSFSDANGNIQHRVDYTPSDGFYYSGDQVYIPLGLCFLRIVLKNAITSKVLTYRSDWLQIFDKVDAMTGILYPQDYVLLNEYLT